MGVVTVLLPQEREDERNNRNKKRFYELLDHLEDAWYDLNEYYSFTLIERGDRTYKSYISEDVSLHRLRLWMQKTLDGEVIVKYYMRYTTEYKTVLFFEKQDDFMLFKMTWVD